MNANQETWMVLAHGQRVMAAELLFISRNADSLDECREALNLSNMCAYVETACRDWAAREAVAPETGNVVEMYCNAIKTWMGAAGHGKARRNREAADIYAARARESGIELPTETEAAARGLFNGPGAV